MLLRIAGKYKVVMDSDAWHVGGQGRVHWDGEHFTQPAEDGKFNERDQYFQVRARLGVFTFKKAGIGFEKE